MVLLACTLNIVRVGKMRKMSYIWQVRGTGFCVIDENRQDGLKRLSKSMGRTVEDSEIVEIAQGRGRGDAMVTLVLKEALGAL